jgi:hypothetical protein
MRLAVASVTALVLGACAAWAPVARADSVARPPDAEQSFVGAFNLGPDVAFVYWDTTGSDRDLHVLIVEATSAFFHTITVSVSLGGPFTPPITGASFWFNHKGFSGPFLIFDIWACRFPQTSNGLCTPAEYVKILEDVPL